jgi:hypothetical protein
MENLQTISNLLCARIAYLKYHLAEDSTNRKIKPCFRRQYQTNSSKRNAFLPQSVQMKLGTLRTCLECIDIVDRSSQNVPEVQDRKHSSTHPNACQQFNVYCGLFGFSSKDTCRETAYQFGY